MYTIYKIDDKQIYLDEKYNLIRVSFSELLNAGETINDIEVLRDFNGWNWNTPSSDIPELSTNLIYQNLIYLLGIDFVKELINTDRVIDYVELIQGKLAINYGEKKAKEILEQIYKASIIICITKREQEYKRLKDEQEDLQKELDRLSNKEGLLNEISIIKKEALKDIKQIDNILNDKKLLEEEFIKRNEKRAEYNKILNQAHLIEILNRERKKLLAKIDDGNHILEPQQYVKTIDKIEKQLKVLEDVSLTAAQKEEKKMQYLINIQQKFLECFDIKIKKASEKEEIINLVYMLRYYKLIYVTENKQIKDIVELKKELHEVEVDLIRRAYQLKVINKITTEAIVNNEIINQLLITRIINL